MELPYVPVTSPESQMDIVHISSIKRNRTWTYREFNTDTDKI